MHNKHERETSILPGKHLRESLGDLAVPILGGVLIELRGHRRRVAEASL